jgi:sn-glycerol 3-phosphate transport system ATP-binding protein
MAEVSFHEVRKVFPGGTTAVEELTFTVEDGEFIVLVGPSGCGKTTVLRMVAGLEEPTSGAVAIGGKVVNGMSPRDRDIAMVFQSYALYPHKSVFENLAFGLRQRKVPKDEIVRRVKDVSSLLALDELLTRKPAQLSGGQRQRVAMGRALARDPRVYLLDEPLSNLDAQLRTQLRADLKQLHKRFPTTAIYVTHDQVEAMTLGDRIAVMNAGRLQQLGPPQDIYRHPANVFVAGFIGSPPMNLLKAVSVGGHVRAGDVEFDLVGAPDGELVIGIRPEAFRIATEPNQDIVVYAHAEVVELLGHETMVHGSIQGERASTSHVGAGLSPLLSDRATIVARLEGRRQPAAGETIALAVPLEEVYLFDPEAGQAIVTTNVSRTLASPSDRKPRGP